ncbi:MAG: alpha/beta fold hydrolase [Aggregatilineales bacterium]
MKNSRLFALIVALMTLLSGMALQAQEGSAGTYEETSCAFDIPAGYVEGTDITCGYVTVPEVHSAPDGATIRIAVAVFNSPAANPADDPLVMTQGGPGGSTLTLFGELLPAVTDFYRQERDVILIEQRGTLFSEPSLTCPELTDRGIELLNQDISAEESLAIQIEVVNACRTRLIDEGVNFDAFDSIENAADVPLIVDALGYTGEYNFYGVSYGAMLGQHLLRDQGDRLRAVVLDAVAPLNQNFMREVPTTAQRVFDEMFIACAASAECSVAFPDLESDFYTLIDTLNENPATVTISDPDLEDVTYEALITGDAMVNIIFSAMYSFPLQMPGYIDAMANGNFSWFELIGGALAIDRTNAIAMQYAVLCAEDGLDYTSDDVSSDGVDARVFAASALAWQDYPNQCEDWNVEQIGDFADEPVATDIPVLALSGQFDPITPPSYADVALVEMTNAYSYTFPGSGHGAIFGISPCPLTIMAEFLGDPTQEPDASCIDTMTVDFTILVANPAETFNIPIPAGWTDNTNDMFNLFEDPETGSLIYGVSTGADADIEVGINEALVITQGEDFAVPLVQSDEILPGYYQYIYFDGELLTIVVATQNNDATVQANVVIVTDQAGLQAIQSVLNPVVFGLQFVNGGVAAPPTP